MAKRKPKEDTEVFTLRTINEPAPRNALEGYYDLVLQYYGIRNVPAGFLLAIANHSFKNQKTNEIYWIPGDRFIEETKKMCRCGERKLNRYFRKCRRRGLIKKTKKQDIYLLNEDFITGMDTTYCIKDIIHVDIEYNAKNRQVVRSVTFQDAPFEILTIKQI